ncbi:unnamed protein product [Hermetia illucens]|uniref:Reverse transcriptase domain-containing protein n=1 Tax=Hermetia illucens TaxID=343691 RepID=A0A7R8UBD9_HERIL|nr:unnamed protein product [Hermetia illucens]
MSWVTKKFDAEMFKENSEIEECWKKCLKARRRSQRRRNRPEFEELHVQYKDARKKLQVAIARSKSEHFKRMCTEADSDPWGGAYRSVMSSLKGERSPPITCPELLQNIVNTLFPVDLNGTSLPAVQLNPDEVPIVENEEVLDAAKRLIEKKTPGPDGIPNIALKVAARTAPGIFAQVFTACLREGEFPEQWKVQKLILIPKAGKPLGDPSSYRPICLVNTIGKLFERVIYNRLLAVAEMEGGFSDKQFGFHKAKSTVDAISMLTGLAQTAIEEGKCCAVITLDVKNAFNSAKWKKIIEALDKIQAPK